MAGPTTSVVTRTLGAVFPGGVRMPVLARYDTRDPLAVVFRFDRGRHGFVDWRFARDLLVEALLWGVAGDGDVRFVVDEADTDRMRLVLDSPDGHAELQLAVVELVDLAAPVERLAPAEGELVDWDADLRRLAERGAA